MQAYTVAYDQAGGDAVFGDTPFLRALASLEAPEPDSGADRPAARPSTRSYNQFQQGNCSGTAGSGSGGCGAHK